MSNSTDAIGGALACEQYLALCLLCKVGLVPRVREPEFLKTRVTRGVSNPLESAGVGVSLCSLFRFHLSSSLLLSVVEFLTALSF